MSNPTTADNQGSNFVILRIIGVEPKNREQTRVQIEKELITAMRAGGYDANDIINIALYKTLSERKILAHN